MTETDSSAGTESDELRPVNAVGPDADESRLASAVEMLGRVVAPATALAAVLYFFGYTREKAFYSHFGVDLGTVTFSTTDYLLHGGGVAFAPMAVLMATAAVVLTAYPVVEASLARRTVRTRKAVAFVIGASGVALFGLAVLGLVSPTKKIGHDLFAPFALGCSVAAAAYLLASAHHLGLISESHVIRTSGRAARAAALVVLAVVAVFWGTATVGRQSGLVAADSFEKSLPTAPRAVIYSQKRIAVTGPGVAFERLDARDAVFAYRYSGLRVLLHNGGRWFLLPAGWTRGSDGYITLIPDHEAGIRVDLAP